MWVHTQLAELLDDERGSLKKTKRKKWKLCSSTSAYLPPVWKPADARCRDEAVTLSRPEGDKQRCPLPRETSQRSAGLQRVAVDNSLRVDLQRLCDVLLDISCFL